MNETRGQYGNPFLAWLVGLLLGTVLGLVVLGWWLWPVQWSDASPESLQYDFKVDQLRTVISAYGYDQNVPLAQARYAYLGEQRTNVLAAIYQDPQTLSPSLLDNFVANVAGDTPETLASMAVTRPEVVQAMPNLWQMGLIAIGVILALLLTWFVLRRRPEPTGYTTLPAVERLDLSKPVDLVEDTQPRKAVHAVPEAAIEETPSLDVTEKQDLELDDKPAWEANWATEETLEANQPPIVSMDSELTETLEAKEIAADWFGNIDEAVKPATDEQSLDDSELEFIPDEAELGELPDWLQELDLGEESKEGLALDEWRLDALGNEDQSEKDTQLKDALMGMAGATAMESLFGEDEANEVETGITQPADESVDELAELEASMMPEVVEPPTWLGELDDVEDKPELSEEGLTTGETVVEAPIGEELDDLPAFLASRTTTEQFQQIEDVPVVVDDDASDVQSDAELAPATEDISEIETVAGEAKAAVVEHIEGTPEYELPAVSETLDEKMRRELTFVEGVGLEPAEKLAEIGISTTGRLLALGLTPKGRKDIADRAGIPEADILKWVNHIDLYRVKGIGSGYAVLLEASGVKTLPDLAHNSAEDLQERLAAINADKLFVQSAPSLEQVTDWIEQARSLPRYITY